jgi:electron transport complex protein RnfD
MKPESPNDLYIVSPSPHTHSGASVERIMLDVLIALAPALLAALWFFRLEAARLTAVCVASCLLTEWLCRKTMKRANTLSDLSAAVTGVLLAFNLPPALPSWMAAAGSVFAIGIAKQVFGGLGYNPFNPALAGRAFMLISFTGAMTTWSGSDWIRKIASTASAAADGASAMAADALTTATPLGLAKEALKSGQALPVFPSGLLTDFFLGNMNGCIGETSALALLLGAAYLLYRKVITWHIPAAYLLTVVVYAAILHVVSPAASVPPLFHLLSGGLLLGACFMATDMATSPVTKSGMLVFGIGCGLITMLIRTVKTGAYPEGVSFAILIMNAFTPLINRATRHRVFGTKK